MIRALSAGLVIVAIVMIALYNIVVEPIWATGVISLNMFRSPTTAMPTDFSGSVPTVWNIVVVRSMTFRRCLSSQYILQARPKYLIRGQDNNLANFSSAVNVTPFWDDWNRDNSVLFCLFLLMSDVDSANYKILLNPLVVLPPTKLTRFINRSPTKLGTLLPFIAHPVCQFQRVNCSV